MRRNYRKFVDDFLSESNMTGSELARAIGVADDTIQGLRRGSISNPQKLTKKKINQFILNYRKGNRPMNIRQAPNPTTDIVGIDSRTVAEWTKKEHKNLIREIRQYTEYLKCSKLSATDFWQETSYTASNGKENPCYLITKKGCEFIQHKMTGQKGTIFTARYINYFHDMEAGLQEATEILLDLTEEPQFTQKAPTDLAEAEQNYINALAQSIIEADSMGDKKALTGRLTSFLQGVEVWS